MFKQIMLRFTIWKWELRTKLSSDVFDLDFWLDEGKPYVSLKEDEARKNKIQRPK